MDDGGDDGLAPRYQVMWIGRQQTKRDGPESRGFERSHWVDVTHQEYKDLAPFKDSGWWPWRVRILNERDKAPLSEHV